MLWDSVSSKKPESKKGNVILHKPIQITIIITLKIISDVIFFSFYWVFAAIDMYSQHLHQQFGCCHMYKLTPWSAPQCNAPHCTLALPGQKNILPYHWIYWKFTVTGSFQGIALIHTCGLTLKVVRFKSALMGFSYTNSCFSAFGGIEVGTNSYCIH